MTEKDTKKVFFRNNSETSRTTTNRNGSIIFFSERLSLGSINKLVVILKSSLSTWLDIQVLYLYSLETLMSCNNKWDKSMTSQVSLPVKLFLWFYVYIRNHPFLYTRKEYQIRTKQFSLSRWQHCICSMLRSVPNDGMLVEQRLSLALRKLV